MVDVKAEVRALLDRLPDDCSYADVQRGIAVLHVGVAAVVGQPVEQRPHLGLHIHHRITISQMPCAR